MKFYTNVQYVGNNIYYRGVNNDEKILEKIPYKPSVFIPTNKESKYKTLDGKFVDKIQPGSIKETKEFIEKYKEVDNFKIYGNTNFHYCYIADMFPYQIDYDTNLMSIGYIDIETSCDAGFPNIDTANEEILAISLKVNNIFYVYGCGEFRTEDNSIKYFRCHNEIELCQKFLNKWEELQLDIISGWNCQFFDLPYLTNRIKRLLGDNEAKRLSPWGILSTRQANYKGKMHNVVDFMGISTLDYIELYRKFQPRQESEKLNYIAYTELGEKKLDYSEYGSLHLLYKQNFQKFIEYNIKDTDLVEKLEQKLKLINMVLATAYDAKVNFTDIFTQVRMWDVIAFNHLKSKNIVVPPKNRNSMKEEYPGGYVKEPKPNLYKWIVSFDLNSLYPSLIEEFNISPECLVEEEKMHLVDVYPEEGNRVDCSLLLERKHDLSDIHPEYALAANGNFFRKDFTGFFPEILNKMRVDRDEYRKKMRDCETELEIVKKELEKEPRNVLLLEKKKELEYSHAKYNNWQMAKKTQLNSMYGAYGNEYFRYYDVRLASAVTISGQLVIQWLSKAVNEYLNSLLKTNQEYVIYMDTDSLFITLDKLVEKVFENKPHDHQKIVDVIDKFSKEKLQKVIQQASEDYGTYLNVYKQKMEMKREAIADQGIFVAKKRYILHMLDKEGTRYAEPKYKIQGIEAVRSTTPEVCRKAIKDAINVIFTKDQDSLLDFIEEFRCNFNKLGAEDIACPTQCNNLEKYEDYGLIFKKGTPMHVKGSLIYNHMIKSKNLGKQYQDISSGDKIKYLCIRQPNSAQANVISFLDILPKEFNLHLTIDYDAQFEKVFLHPLSLILDAIDWKTERVCNLEGLFG